MKTRLGFSLLVLVCVFCWLCQSVVPSRGEAEAGGKKLLLEGKVVAVHMMPGRDIAFLEEVSLESVGSETFIRGKEITLEKDAVTVYRWIPTRQIASLGEYDNVKELGKIWRLPGGVPGRAAAPALDGKTDIGR